MSESGQAERPGVGVYQVEMFDAAENAVGTMTAGHFVAAVNLGWEYVKREFCARFVVSRVLFDSDRVELERYDVRRPAFR